MTQTEFYILKHMYKLMNNRVVKGTRAAITSYLPIIERTTNKKLVYVWYRQESGRWMADSKFQATLRGYVDAVQLYYDIETESNKARSRNIYGNLIPPVNDDFFKLIDEPLIDIAFNVIEGDPIAQDMMRDLLRI